VSCNDLRTLLHAYLDDELDAADRAACAEHLRVCPECHEELESLRAVRAALRDEELRHRPPPTLVARLEAALAAADRPRRRTGWWLGLAATAAAALLLGLGLALGAAWRQRESSAEERLAREVTSAHARALQPKHLLDKPSSEQHQVKPWFQGSLDFSPPVKDLSGHGFELEGGRLDYLEERPVAALVYRRREHVINLFVWPTEQADGAPRTAARRGYHLVWWTKDGMNFWAVSDLNADELAAFARLYRESSAP
jgi:anti-sigma factor RsiW